MIDKRENPIVRQEQTSTDASAINLESFLDKLFFNIIVNISKNISLFS